VGLHRPFEGYALLAMDAGDGREGAAAYRQDRSGRSLCVGAARVAWQAARTKANPELRTEDMLACRVSERKGLEAARAEKIPRCRRRCPEPRSSLRKMAATADRASRQRRRGNRSVHLTEENTGGGPMCMGIEGLALVGERAEACARSTALEPDSLGVPLGF